MASHTEVPFVDLALVHRDLREALLRDIEGIIESSAFTNGPAVREFERAFSSYCDTDFCIGVASGLDALRLGLIACGVSRGDEVIVPAATFIATFEAVSQLGAVPVAVDVKDDDWNIDVAAVEASITDRTRAFLPVHLYGQMADVVTLRAVAARHDIRLVEDACQAHGATRDGVRAGAAGDAAAFSFYPSKNLGAFGDAGAVTTNRRDIAERVAALREHGQRTKYEHDSEGYTSRLDTIQAAVLVRKLPHLETWNEQRRNAAEFYCAELANTGDLRLPVSAVGSSSAWHLFVVRTDERQQLEAHLLRRGVLVGRHYPYAVPFTAAYDWLNYERGAFPVAEALAQDALSLPLFPGITDAQLEHVVGEIKRYFSRV